jgi:hypothetical protein
MICTPEEKYSGGIVEFVKSTLFWVRLCWALSLTGRVSAFFGIEFRGPANSCLKKRRKKGTETGC